MFSTVSTPVIAISFNALTVLDKQGKNRRIHSALSKTIDDINEEGYRIDIIYEEADVLEAFKFVATHNVLLNSLRCIAEYNASSLNDKDIPIRYYDNNVDMLNRFAEYFPDIELYKVRKKSVIRYNA